jgi:hypothetical protein
MRLLIDSHPDAMAPVLTIIAKVRKDAYDKACEVYNQYRAPKLWHEANSLYRRYANVLELEEMWNAFQSAREIVPAK